MTRDTRLDMACGSDTGQVRSRNEDHVRIIPEMGLAILSDGMGGHRAGDVASRIAVEGIGDRWEALMRSYNGHSTPAHGGRRADDLVAAVTGANETIYGLSRKNPEFQGMGATVIAVHFDDGEMCAVHLGDSRLYRFRRGQLQQLTTDHTHAQESVRMGLISAEEAKGGYGWNLLLKALGVEAVIEPDVIVTPVESGDIYLMGSDGLTDAVSDDEIRTRIALGNNQLADIIEELIDLANQNGGPDNISVVLIRIP
jgi:serine/threonine protein phosphatase PrpC